MGEDNNQARVNSTFYGVSPGIKMLNHSEQEKKTQLGVARGRDFGMVVRGVTTKPGEERGGEGG